jgi:mTERF domain-containing protein, mitochondrial
MFHCHRLRALLYSSSSPKCYVTLKPFSFSTTISSDSDKQSFTVSYLINNCGLSPQDALKASKRFHFNTPHKPDSFISFFKTHGFSNDQIQSIIRRIPPIIVSNPIKTILPKFQFLASKGASPQDIIVTVTKSPRFLCSSLDKQIIPAFDLVRSFCPSDQRAITIINSYPTSIARSRMKPNVHFLLDFGVNPSSIYYLLSSRPSIFCISDSDFRKVVEEIKGLGFHPSNGYFCVALRAKMAISKSHWDAKVDAFKSWGCSEDDILTAFKRKPSFMLRSRDKLNAVMRFWVKQHGWDPFVLLKAPDIFGFSIEKRLIPRASVVQYLLSKGLMKKSASLYTPFSLTDELFLKRYVNYFEEEASTLLRLYQGGC